MTYTFVYLDKAMLGYAAVFNLQEDLHLAGTDYNWLSSIFYFGYLAVSHTPNASFMSILARAG